MAIGSLNVQNLIIILLLSGLLMLIANILLKTAIEKFCVLITLIMGIFYSGLGILFKGLSNDNYLLSYLIFYFFLVITLIIILKGTKNKINIELSTVIQKNIKIIIFLGAVSLFSQLMKLIYPEFRLFELFAPQGFMYDSDFIKIKTARLGNSIYIFFDYLKVFTYPFFLIWLYTLRKNPRLFIFLAFFYQYIEFVQNKNIGRNSIAVLFTFIFIYLYIEKIIRRRILNYVLVTVLVLAIPFFNFLYFARIGQIDIVNVLDFGNAWNLFVSQEAKGGQLYLEFCESFYPKLSFLKMLGRWITLPIPIIPNIDFPILSYLFSERLLGVSYGKVGYYIMLPGAFGEGLMMLGKYYVWVYGAFIGAFVGIIFNKLKNIPEMRYFLIYFLLDYARAFRGGIQTFISSIYNMSLLLIIFFIWIKYVENKKIKNNQQ